MVVLNQSKHLKVLKQSPTNDRSLRQRPETQLKNEALHLLIDQARQENSFAQLFGEFGTEWAKKYKGKGDALPTPNDLIEGLMQWITKQIENKLVPVKKEA